MTPEHKALVAPSDDLIAFCIKETLGERCETFDADCYTCQAWAEYDALMALSASPAAQVEAVDAVTDAMVEAALKSLHCNPVAWEHPTAMHSAIAAALGASPVPVPDAVEATVTDAEIKAFRTKYREIFPGSHPDRQTIIELLTASKRAVSAASEAFRSALASHMPVGDGYVPAAQKCATDRCEKPASVHFIRGGIGSYYCHDCYMHVQSLAASTGEANHG